MDNYSHVNSLPLKDFTDEIEELLPKRLWVVKDITEYSARLHFVTFHRSDLDYSNIEVDTLFTVDGTTGLREMRHTHFRDDGYVFYLSKDEMYAALKYCEKLFDMD